MILINNIRENRHKRCLKEMELKQVINKRRSIRKYEDDKPSLEEIKEIIDSARLAPSASNAQMWHFIAIYNSKLKDNIKKVIENKYEEIKSWPGSKGSESELDRIKGNSTFFLQAPVIIACLMEPIVSFREKILKTNGITEEEIIRMVPKRDIISMGAAIENILLTSVDLGYGACWLNAPVVAYKEIEPLLNVDKKFQLVSFVAIGKGSDTSKRVPKKQLEDILTIIE